MSYGKTISIGDSADKSELTRFADGGYIRINSAAHERAVVWPTTASLPEIMRAALASGELAADEQAALVAPGKNPTALTPEGAIRRILQSKGSHLTDVWVPFKSFSLSWTEATKSRLAEVAMVLNGDRPRFDLALLERTGTDDVKANARKVLGRSALVSVAR